MTQTLIQIGHRLLPQRSATSAGDDAARLLHALTLTLPSDFASLSEVALEGALGAMADATKAAIAADLACFTQWCAAERRTAFPTSPEDLVRYILFLDAAPKKPATIARRLASIARAHRMLGFGMAQALPTQAGMVKDALKGVRRRRGTAQRQAAPMRLGAAMRDDEIVGGVTLTALLSVCAADLQGLRDAALLSVGYDGGLRVGELTAIVVADIERQPEGIGLLHLPRSKTDQTGQGAWVWLSRSTMTKLDAWQTASGIVEGPVFRRVGVDRRSAAATALASITYTVGDRPLTRQGVTGIYRRLVAAAIDAGATAVSAADAYTLVRAISTHSLRVGLVHDLFAAGEDGSGIALALRWSSPTTALRYGRKLGVRNNSAARVLSRHR